MGKFKLIVFSGVAAALVAGSLLAVQADTTNLAVTCSGSVSGNAVTWTASPSGGNAPYALLWSGDSSVAGSTSTTQQITYGTNATYNAMIQVTDASSTVATSSCQAVVTANVVPIATSTLNVFVGVNNTAGGAATPASFTVNVSGASASPSSFAGSNTGTTVVLNATSSYSVGASSLANYTMTTNGNCSGTLAAGTIATCTVTETYVAPPVTPTPTSTTPLPRVNQPSFSIGAKGQFSGQGMTVTSVASGSFQASIWGITYTINWSGNLFPQFYFRGGNSAVSSTNPTGQVNVGDEVSVTGKVAASSPFVITASSVRDFSITMSRSGGHNGPKGQSWLPDYSKKGNNVNKGNNNGNNTSTGNGNSKGGDNGNNFWKIFQGWFHR